MPKILTDTETGEQYEMTPSLSLSMPQEVFNWLATLGADTKIVRPLPAQRKRWRAEREQLYFTVNTDGDTESLRDYRDDTDDRLYSIGNYFQTEAQATAAAEAIRATLAAIHSDPESSDTHRAMDTLAGMISAAHDAIYGTREGA